MGNFAAGRPSIVIVQRPARKNKRFTCARLRQRRRVLGAVSRGKQHGCHLAIHLRDETQGGKYFEDFTRIFFSEYCKVIAREDLL